MVQRPGDHHAVWHMWSGPERELSCWYINLQTDFVRTQTGYDTQDLELDIWLPREGGHVLKDDHVMEERVAEGRFTADQVAFTRAEAARIVEELGREGRWWPDEWASWEPDPAWPTPIFPDQRR
jgi:hypothetical protein